MAQYALLGSSEGFFRAEHVVRCLSTVARTVSVVSGVTRAGAESGRPALRGDWLVDGQAWLVTEPEPADSGRSGYRVIGVAVARLGRLIWVAKDIAPGQSEAARAMWEGARL